MVSGLLGSSSIVRCDPARMTVSLIGLSKISPLHRFRMRCPLPGLKYRCGCTGWTRCTELVVRRCTVTCGASLPSTLRMPIFGFVPSLSFLPTPTVYATAYVAGLFQPGNRSWGSLRFVLGPLSNNGRSWFPSQCRAHEMLSHSPTALYPSKLFPQHERSKNLQ